MDLALRITVHQEPQWLQPLLSGIARGKKNHPYVVEHMSDWNDPLVHQFRQSSVADGLRSSLLEDRERRSTSQEAAFLTSGSSMAQKDTENKVQQSLKHVLLCERF